MIVMKFGGTSVKDKEAMERVFSIVSERRRMQPLVVLSACSGITDKLLDLARAAADNPGDYCNRIYEEIADHHLSLADELISDPNFKTEALERVNNLCRELIHLIEGITLLKECTPRSMDVAASYGELLSSAIFETACRAKGLDSVFVDARSIIATDSRFGSAMPIHEDIALAVEENLYPLLERGKIIVTQGFIGSDSEGRTTTLGRGGSDYTAALIGAAAGAGDIQIWTDVPGVLTADPRLVPKAVTIPRMTFAEVRELSFYGAKVLHPDTIKPAIEKGIPVSVLNSLQPDVPGTSIIERIPGNKPEFRSVLLKEKCLLCTADIPYTENSQLFFSKLLRVLTKAGVKILSSICTENNCQLILDYNTAEFSTETFEDVKAEYKLNIEPKALICLCGNNLLYADENISRFLVEIAGIISISKPPGFIFGASSLSIIILIQPVLGQIVLREIHSLLFPCAK